jgi:hypothetical protein
MKIHFEYETEKGLIEVRTEIEPIIIKDSGEEIVWLNNLKKEFKFSKKLFIEVLEHWCAIRFSRHTTQSYTIWGTQKAIPANFFYPITREEPKSKKSYLCALTGVGVQLIELLDSLIQTEDDFEDFVKQWFSDYLTFLKETK